MNELERPVKPLDYRARQIPAGRVPLVQIESSSEGGIAVRVNYPADKWRKALIQTVIFMCLQCALPAVAWWMFRGVRLRWIAPLIFSIAPLITVTVLAIRLCREAQSYLITADARGIAIDRFRGRHEWRHQLTREQVKDVRIGFGRRDGSTSKSWLIIATHGWHRPNMRLLHDLGGDHLARVADAIRSGIGLPKRSWP